MCLNSRRETLVLGSFYLLDSVSRRRKIFVPILGEGEKAFLRYFQCLKFCFTLNVRMSVKRKLFITFQNFVKCTCSYTIIHRKLCSQIRGHLRWEGLHLPSPVSCYCLHEEN